MVDFNKLLTDRALERLRALQGGGSVEDSGDREKIDFDAVRVAVIKITGAKFALMKEDGREKVIPVIECDYFPIGASKAVAGSFTAGSHLWRQFRAIDVGEAEARKDNDGDFKPGPYAIAQLEGWCGFVLRDPTKDIPSKTKGKNPMKYYHVRAWERDTPLEDIAATVALVLTEDDPSPTTGNNADVV